MRAGRQCLWSWGAGGMLCPSSLLEARPLASASPLLSKEGGGVGFVGKVAQKRWALKNARAGGLKE